MVKKIALISEHASPLASLGGVDSGGQNVYVAQVAKNLALMGHEVDIFTRRDDKGLEEIHDWENGIRVIHVPAGPAKYMRKEDLYQYIPAFIKYLSSFIKKQDVTYDIIHANFWMSGLIAAEIKKEYGIPFVITFHALGKVRRIYQGKADGFPDERLSIEERIVNEADHIIAECPQDEEDLIQLYRADPTKITIVPCGFNPRELWPISKSEARKKLKLPQNERIVLQLGRMVPRKGVDNVIRGAAKLIKDIGIPIRLLVVGGESDEPDPQITPEIGRLQAIAQKEGIADSVMFIGRRDRNLLKYYYSAADIFITTPWYEPFGITPVEAMACGTPVIGSNVGGIKYTVNDAKTGYLVPANEPDALAQKMAYLFKAPELLEQFSKQAILHANDQFTWEKVTDTLANLYDRVVQSAKADIWDQISQTTIVSRGFEKAQEALSRSQISLEVDILKAANAMISCFQSGNKVMVCGNGGSAADAQHFAAEFMGRFKLPGRAGLPVVALNSDSVFLTAWSNDIGFEKIFSRQIQALGKPGDMLIAISTSGQSTNLIEAVEYAHANSITCLSILGGDGGSLLKKTDLAIVVPAFEPDRIQEVQILILHLLSELVEEHLFSEPTTLDQSIARSQGELTYLPETTSPSPYLGRS
jgi:D-inositol-3-phosphate glycosyltransferase